MKLAQETSPVTITGAVGAPSRFNITASKEAFRILSSGLYNNKIAAIIRELSCNAWDAHRAAGKGDVPFELHLPTTFEPFFTVKDEGIGLSYCPQGCVRCKATGKLNARMVEVEGQEAKEVFDVCDVCAGTGDYDQVLDLYCNYFSTSKSNSNEYIGALGLGSKSPFCYTEGFSVVNTFDGMKRIYSCFLDGSGLPTALLQTAVEAPGAHAGLEVSFPVKTKDIWEFENQATQVLEFFEPRPIVNSNLNITHAEYVIRAETWGLRKNDKLNNRIRAIQGTVAYDIGEIDKSKLNEEQRELLGLPLDLFFPIGQISVTASRESLSNDPTTIANILARLATVKDFLIEDVKKQLAKAKSHWEARVLLFSLSNTQGIGKFVQRAHRAGEFNGIGEGWALTQDNPFINQLDYPEIKITRFEKSWRRGGYRLQANKEDLTEELPDAKQLANTVLTNDRRYRIEFSIRHADMLFIINDVGFGADRYVHHLVQQDESYESGAAYFITRADKDVTVERMVEQGLRIIEQLGNPPYKLLSELKEKYKADMPNRRHTVRQLLWFDTTNSLSSSNNERTISGWRNGWEDAKNKQPEAEDFKYYVLVKALEPLTGNFGNAHEFRTFIQAAREMPEFGLQQETIYGVPERYAGKLDETWIEFTGYVMTRLVEEVMTPWKEVHLSLHLNPFTYSHKRMLQEIKDENLLPATSPLRQFCDKLADAEKYDKTQIKHLAVLVAKAAQLGLYATKHAVDFNEKWAAIEETYPLIGQIDSWDFKTSEKVQRGFCDYINMIDERNANERQSSVGMAPVSVVELAANLQTITEENASDTIN